MARTGLLPVHIFVSAGKTSWRQDQNEKRSINVPDCYRDIVIVLIGKTNPACLT